MKKKMQILLLALTMILLCGCGCEEIVKVSSSGKITTKMYFYGTSKECKKNGSIGTKKINGKKFYKFATKETYDTKLKCKMFKLNYIMADGDKNTVEQQPITDTNTAKLTKSYFIYESEDSTTPGADFYTLKITFPKKIKYTNGKLSKDKKTVIFDMTKVKVGDIIYAYTSKVQALSANVGPIQLTGLNQYGHLTKAKTLKVKTDEKIKYIKVNGKKQSSDKIKIKKEGKYKIQVKTNKNTVTFNVCYDKTKPKVKVKDVGNGQKKITFSDSNSGIKFAKLAGKYIESGHVTSITGSYNTYVEVYDNAGNMKKVKVVTVGSEF